ncbi:GNAT family N-acetyltransferase [Sphingosinicella terrae]|uniref:GNAT family N-acetyltransferase n=1 Tax=Sphingosinicella terrae TaxID=2172047 RepID=UPI000E0D3DEE|nr:GNAT family N-acetyltransferase [Sphingosinicella terrae]
MSERDDALRAMAANRGCKLVKSRRRKPGGDFGCYGLKDGKSGKEVLGFGEAGLTATAEEVESYLRGGLKASWKRSLISAVPDGAAPAARPRKAAEKPLAERRQAPSVAASRSRRTEKAPDAQPAEAPAPKPERRAPDPKRPAPRRRRESAAPEPPRIREAMPRDAAALARLIGELGYEATEAEVRKRLAELRKRGEAPLVADRGGVIGCLTWHVRVMLHRPRPVGRISMMVVTEAARGAGVGALLVEAAEARFRELGCGLVEVTSNMKRMRAHAFYERLGYERTSYRFARTLQD